MASKGDVAAVWLPMSKLHPWEGNPRKNKDTIRRVAASIKKFGWGAVIVARQDNGEMIAGHTRYAAAEVLCRSWTTASEAARKKWHADARRTAETETVPARLGSWSEHEAHQLAIADNKIPEYSEWDNEKLAELLDGYTRAEVEAVGYEGKELSRLFASLKEDCDEPDGKSVLSGLSFRVVVDCVGEEHQQELLERFETEGLICRPLIS